MSDKNDKYEPLSAEDQALWDQFVLENLPKNLSETLSDAEDIEEDFEALLNEFETSTDGKPIQKKTISPSKIELNNISKTQSRALGIDGQIEKKLRKGKLKIESRLDLHGKRQSEAYKVLDQFIQRALKQNHRCVLIITGKGRSRISTDSVIEPETGILKQKLPQWLSTEPFKSHVLRVLPAHIKDGGSGAFYVYLRRQK